MKFSVIVVTYNPKIEKVLFTLKSILKQDFDDYEIVISDDGSEDNCFSQIEDYFRENHFENYVLIPHEENQGTVKNLISALEHARGTYVRDFGPGDAFYNETSLSRIYDFFEERQCQQCFGLMRGYRRDEDGIIHYENFCHPFDIQAYRRDNSQRRILKNLVLYSDNVSGACMCYKRKFYLEYLKKIESYVIYEEDIFQVLAGMEGHKMEMIDAYTVLYEVEAGVSAGGNSRFAKLLAEDVERFYQELYRNYKNHPFVKKRQQVRIFNVFQNIYIRTLFRLFLNPDAIRYLCISAYCRLFKKHEPRIKESSFMDRNEF